MDRIKKYLQFDFLFPIMMVYLFMPISGWIIRATGITEVIPMDFELLYLLGAMFLSLWWILLYYDGTLKTAMSWWVRYVVMILPVWLVHYVIHVNDAFSYVYLEYLLINVLVNLIVGFIGFGLRKLLHDNRFIYILVAVVCIYTLRPFGMWM